MGAGAGTVTLDAGSEPSSTTVARMRRGRGRRSCSWLIVGASALLVVDQPPRARTRPGTRPSRPGRRSSQPLDARYAALATRSPPRPTPTLQASGEDNSVTDQGMKLALDAVDGRRKADDAEKMVAAANDLEARVGQLRAVLGASARLSQTPDGRRGARTAFDTDRPARSWSPAYNEAGPQVPAHPREHRPSASSPRCSATTPIPTFEPSLAT